jgi:hypothetical protein
MVQAICILIIKVFFPNLNDCEEIFLQIPQNYYTFIALLFAILVFKNSLQLKIPKEYRGYKA